MQVFIANLYKIYKSQTFQTGNFVFLTKHFHHVTTQFPTGSLLLPSKKGELKVCNVPISSGEVGKSVAYHEGILVEHGAVAQEGIALIAGEDVAGLEVVGAMTTGTLHLLAVAGPYEGQQGRTVRADAVVGSKSVEIGAADNESYLVAGSEHIDLVVFLLGGGDVVVFLTLLAAIALCQHMAKAVVVNPGIDIDISSGGATGRKNDTCFMALHVKTETAGIAMTNWIVFFAR